MTDAIKTALVTSVLVLLVVGAFKIGLLRWDLPFSNAFPRDVTDVSQRQEVEEPRITRIEAVALDCRARIHAVVDVDGVREHRVMGQVYRTDTVEVSAVGDIDTCVDATQVSVVEGADGRFHVTIPGEAISFERPRVDLINSEGARYEQGFAGDLAGLFPGVSNSEPLSSGAFAYAQYVIGSSACMESAFEVTQQIIEQAYYDQLLAQGAPPDQIEIIIGEPRFDQNPLPDQAPGITFDTDGPVRCTLAPDAHDGVSPTWEDVGAL